MLDEPEVAERKSSPHRSIIALLGVLVSAFAGIVWITAIELWNITRDYRKRNFSLGGSNSIVSPDSTSKCKEL